jgi:hypothetical protein
MRTSELAMQRIACLVCLFAVATPAIVRAQETSIAGAVADATDARLPGVTVTALHVQSGNTFVGVTDASGQYRIGAMRTGVYTITVELPGFNVLTQQSVELLVGQRSVLNFRMALASIDESVTVTAGSPLVNLRESNLGGNVDSRQVQELPVNGRNWMQLTLLAPGSRANVATLTPDESSIGGHFQLNLDGQQMTQLMGGTSYGQPQFSRDAIGEFQFVSNRFDATQGRSDGSQVNAVTKSGSNAFSGTFSGYFRSDQFNAADFIVHRVLPYSDQQVSGTFGGPIVLNKMHFFGYYEGERNPLSITFNSPYSAFNIAPLLGVNTNNMSGFRFDDQIDSSVHLMVRGNAWLGKIPYDPASCGGATAHPSTCATLNRESGNVFFSLSQTIGSRKVNELKIGFTNFGSRQDPVVRGGPTISMVGYRFGAASSNPLYLTQNTPSIRDDFTYLIERLGHHEMKFGGEYLRLHTNVLWGQYMRPQYDANLAAVPANIQALFPLWNDPSTWNIGALSTITRQYHAGIGSFQFNVPASTLGAWLQDNWSVAPRLTLNVGLRYDLQLGAYAEDILVPPFRTQETSHLLKDLAPRTGFAYSLSDNKTVIRGGFGKYFAGITTRWIQHTIINQILAVPEDLNTDRRSNFVQDPFNGAPPSYQQIIAPGSPWRREAQGSVTAPTVQTPYLWQSSVGIQRQLSETASVQADVVLDLGRQQEYSRQVNLTYNPATGANYAFTDIATRPYPNWGAVTERFTGATSKYRGLETAFTKRLSHRVQASATYTLSARDDNAPAPVLPGCSYPMITPGVCNVPITLRPDLGPERGPAVGDQRHRAVFNGIFQLPYGLQASGLYFFGSGQRLGTTYGGDLANSGGATSRLRPDGTIVPRNNFVGNPLHRVDVRLLRHFPIGSTVKIDGMVEIFNVFNHENDGSYVTTESSAAYGQPQQNVDVAYQPRMLQLGFRLVF